MYAKIVNGNLHPAPTCLWDGNVMYANPTMETLTRLGYMEVVETPMPEPAEGWYWKPIYKEENGKIVQDWEFMVDENYHREPNELEDTSGERGGGE